MLKIERRQHPVGQGFFHTATLEHQNDHIHYVYDCGSENVKSLQREVQSYASGLESTIALLFLSHLDHDHVNGLDGLLVQARAETVILPYLSVYERISLAVRALERETLDGNYLALLSDPVRWMQSRNVSRIVFVVGTDDGDPSFPDGSLPSPDDQGHDLPRVKPSLAVDLKPLGPPTLRRNEKGVVAIQTVTGDTAIPVVAGDIPHLDWYLLPFVHPEPRQEPNFRRHVVAQWNERFRNTPFPAERRGVPHSFSAWLLQQVQDKERREHLAQCYSQIRVDRNLTSMSLYSGPLSRRLDLFTSGTYRSVRGNGSNVGNFWDMDIPVGIGWLATGDADLLGERRRIAFLRHYQRVLDNVGTMALPHHGSRHNFHRAMMPASAYNYLVGAGHKNSYGHPHKVVKDTLKSVGKELLLVDENHSSFFQETIILS